MAATKTKKATVFVSGVESLRLVRTPKVRRMNDRGEWETTDGDVIEFHNGTYEAKSDDEAKWLRDHDLHDAIGQAGSFVEQGKEPGRALPESADLLKAIVEAVAKKDSDTIAEIYVQERASHSRDEVLKAAAAALEALDSDVPPPPDTPAHEVTRAREAGTVGAQPGKDEGVAESKGK